jgi:UTP--glucose-1-phosphate uridylyltransferase
VPDTSQTPLDSDFSSKLEETGAPEAAVAAFALHLRRYLEGESGILGRDLIGPVADLPDAERLDPGADPDLDLLSKVVVIKLNGGLGTGMGLETAKSLIEVRPGSTFLDLIARQILSLRRTTASRIPLLLMNSFRTAEDTAEKLSRIPRLSNGGLPNGFLQHRVPKILVGDRTPVVWPRDPELEWCPPGHGDIFHSLATSGLLERLVDEGFELAFISNSDNLGAVLDPALLAHMARSGADFMMEVADRTAADRKGGHLCRLGDGRLALRESAQCPADEIDEFQNIDLFRYFNTNNIWVSLPALAGLLERHDGVLPLDTIVNHKKVDPRDSGSPDVVQLETAMGAAISLFDHATAIRVSRRRFSPVKNTDDLLAVRSDAFELTDDGRVVLARGRSTPPTIRLDPKFFKVLDEFDRRFPNGPPSLERCTSLSVSGDVTFGEGVVVEGEVTIRGSDQPSRVPDGAVLRSERRA